MLSFILSQNSAQFYTGNKYVPGHLVVISTEHNQLFKSSGPGSGGIGLINLLAKLQLDKELRDKISITFQEKDPKVFLDLQAQALSSKELDLLALILNQIRSLAKAVITKTE